MRLPRLSLTIWILISFILGISAGLVFGDLCSVMKPLTEVFIKIWQITILPSVVISLIVGVGRLKRDTAKAIAIKAFLILLLIWVICIIGYFSFQMAFPPRIDASFFSTQHLTAKTDINLINQFIPSNPFMSLSNGIIPATVIFCLFLGFALMLDDGSGPILHSLRVLMRALDRMMHIIAWTFPIGIFVITAGFSGSLTFKGFLDLQVYIITLTAAGILLGLIVMPLLITCFTTFRYRDILTAAARPLLLSFSTGNSFITLPLISEGVETLFQNQDKNSDNISGSDTDRKPDPGQSDLQSYSELLVPVAFTFPLLGGLYPLLFILFVAWLYQDPLSLIEQAQLIVVGIPTLFGSSTLSVITLLNQMQLPVDAYNMFISSSVLSYFIVAPLGVISIFTFTTLTISLITNQARFRWKRAILSVLVVLLLAAVMIAGLNVGFANLLAGTYHGDDQISKIELPHDSAGRRLDSVVNTTVYLRKEDVPVIVPKDYGGRDEIRQIRERGLLRVGYNSNNIPFVFFNGKGELVGYDVEMAYDLARSLNVTRIEFVPVTGTTLAESLDSGYCDIIMSSVIINVDRLEKMKFTDPVIATHMAFVVPDGKKEEFRKLESVKKMDGLRVAVFKDTALVNVAKRLLPGATLILINSEKDFFEEGMADALLISAEEGYTMTLQYPFFDVAIVEPNNYYLMMFGYPVARNSSESYLLALNYWIQMEKEYGLAEKKYDYWVLGRIPSSVEPRWSVVRDVLHLGV